MGKIRNSKFEIRSNHQLPMTKSCVIGIWSFVIDSSFEFRHSNFAWAVMLLSLASALCWADSPNDHFYPQSWHHQQIGSEAAWAINGGSRSVVVAVIDTGVDAAHPDLAGAIGRGWEFPKNTARTSPLSLHRPSVARGLAGN